MGSPGFAQQAGALVACEVFGTQGAGGELVPQPFVDAGAQWLDQVAGKGFPTETGPVIEAEQGVKAGAMGRTHGFKVQ